MVAKKLHQLSVAEAFRSLGSGEGGLTGAEAVRRRGEYGPNRIERVRRRSAVSRFLAEFTHFFAVILWVAAGLAFFAAARSPGSGMAGLGWAIVGVIVVNAVFSFSQEFRAERALERLQELLPHQATVMRDGVAQSVPSEDVVPGDVCLLEEGDDVPADARVMTANGLRVNVSTVTGESVPVARDAAVNGELEPLHASNVVLTGTSVVAGRATAVAYATGMNTEFGRIARLAQARPDRPSPLQVEIRRVSRVIAVLSVVLGIVFFGIGLAAGVQVWDGFMFAIGVIVANVPEGLLPTVTLSLAMASQRMARRNVLVRHLPAVETLGAATVICTDKTGTLTLNQMTVRRALVDGRWVDADGSEWGGLADRGGSRLIEVAALCHDVREVGGDGGRRTVGDPMELALIRAVTGRVPEGGAFRREAEAPFDAGRRMMSAVYRTPAGKILYVKGAPEVVIERCRGIEHLRGRVEPLTDDSRERLLAEAEEAARAGLRVVGCAWRDVDGAVPSDLKEAERDLVFCGLVALADPPRPEVPAAIARCREAGIRVIMATGDHPRTGEAIGRQIGLFGAGADVRVITGDELRHMSPVQVQLALDAPDVLFARVGADQKLSIVEALKRKGHVVAVTGDGVNDAPALRAADIGVAMGRGGTDVARESADVVLMDDNFASIVAGVEEGRAVYANIRKFLTYVMTSNVAELVPYLAFVLFRIPLALTVIQVLAVDLGTDMLPAMALGAQPPEQGLMRQPPRSRRARLFDWRLLARSYAFLGVFEALAGMAAFFYVLEAAGWRRGGSVGAEVYRAATTACLTGIVVAQMTNVFLCRNETRSVVYGGRGGVGVVLGAVVIEVGLILAFDYTAVGWHVLGTGPIGLSVWLFVIPFAVLMLVAEEIRKFVARELGTRRGHAEPIHSS